MEVLHELVVTRDKPGCWSRRVDDKSILMVRPHGLMGLRLSVATSKPFETQAGDGAGHFYSLTFESSDAMHNYFDDEQGVSYDKASEMVSALAVALKGAGDTRPHVLRIQADNCAKLVLMMSGVNVKLPLPFSGAAVPLDEFEDILGTLNPSHLEDDGASSDCREEESNVPQPPTAAAAEAHTTTEPNSGTNKRRAGTLTVTHRNEQIDTKKQRAE